MTDHAADKAVEEFLRRYCTFTIWSRNDDGATLAGSYILDADHDGIRLSEEFGLKIMVPWSFPYEIPVVKEITDIIPSDYEHLYPDHTFCLGINGELVQELVENPSLISFMEGAVSSYLYTALFHKKYKRYPYGDRPHGAHGILQYYTELFGVSSDKEALSLLGAIYQGRYRGHLPCPCGSGIKTRKCHGKQLLEIANSPLAEALKEDYRSICVEAWCRHEQQERLKQALTSRQPLSKPRS